MKMFSGFTLAGLALMSSVALAGNMPTAVPSTTEYIIETRPMIIGTVASVNDHGIVINAESDHGAPVSLKMDTRTMLPTDLAGREHGAHRVPRDGKRRLLRPAIVPLRTEAEREWPIAT